MEPSLKDNQYYLTLMRRHLILIALVCAFGSAGVTAVALSLPSIYRSTATILIEEPEVPREIVQSTISGYAAQRIQSIRQRVMTTPKLISLLEKYDLYAAMRASQPITVAVERFRAAAGMELVNSEVIDPRSGRPTNATIAFTLSFEHESPLIAQQVANELTSLYLAENLIDRQNKAAETTSFLQSEAGRLGASIKDMDSKIAAFKEQNAGRLPEQLNINTTALERANRDIYEMERQIQALAEQRGFLESELTGVSEFSTYVHDGEAVQSPAQRLKAALAKYASLKGVYTESHPDMVKLRREIESLSRATGGGSAAQDLKTEEDALVAELARARERYADDHPEVQQIERRLEAVRTSIAGGAIVTASKSLSATRPDNPAYLQIRARLNAADIEIASLRDRQAKLIENRDTLEAAVRATPEVERQFRLLMRDYENAQNRYREIKDKELEAELAQSLETDSKSERFTLIEPALKPVSPVRPNRPIMFGLGFIISLAIGVGIVLFMDSFDLSVRGARQVEALVGEPPLVTVPRIGAPSDPGWFMRRARRLKAAVARMRAPRQATAA